MSDRLFHADGCALFEDHPVSRGCTCSAADRLALDEIEAQRQRAIDNREAWDAWRAAGCPAGEILHPRDLYALRKRVTELDLCREVLERMLAGESFVGDGLREMLEQIETPADRHRRFEKLRDQLIAANICLACGAHTPGRSCQCENDE